MMIEIKAAVMAFVLTVVLCIIAACLMGCGGGKQVDIWQGTYTSEGDFLIDKGLAKFTADLEQTDPDTGYVEKAKVELQGYSSETSEVVGLFLDFITANFDMTKKQLPANVRVP